MEDRVFSLLYTPHVLPDPIAPRTLEAVTTAAMEAGAANPIYRTGESHPSAAPAMDGSWDRIGRVIPEFISKGKLVWGLLLPIITNRLHRP